MNFKNLAMWAVIVILTIGLYNMFKNPQGSVNQKNNIIFSEFLTQVDNGRVVQVEIQGKNINDNSNYLKLTNSIILKDDFLKQPDEIVFRSFSELIQKIGKKETFARGAKVDNLIKFLRSTNNNSKKTLSGCIIQKLKNSVIISSEKR